MTLLVHAPDGYAAERRYVLDVVLSDWLGLAYELVVHGDPRVVIRLAGDERGAEIVLPDTVFATTPADWLTERSLPRRPLARLGGVAASPPTSRDGSPAGDLDSNPVPILFGEAGSGRVWRSTPRGLATTIDIFGSVFHLLTRYEEVVVTARDGHDRFPASASLAATEGFLERPIADEYTQLLWSGISSVWPALVPRRSSSVLRLTHDVDQPWAAYGVPNAAVAHALAGDLLRRRDPALAWRRAVAALDARHGRVDRDPLATFDLLMETSERHGLRSTFFFLAGTAPGEFDFRYRLSTPPLQKLLREIHRRGHEVGLHASYVSHRSPGRIRLEFEALREACRAAGVDQSSWGVRQHYLRFAAPVTWRSQEAAGLAYDSTVGFADQIGFRAGTCREFAVFDLHERRTLRLRERPLVAMDATLLEYMGLPLESAASRCRKIVDTCRRFGGDAVLLYHNGTLAQRRHQAHYRDLIADLTR